MSLHFEEEIPFAKVNVHSIVLAEDGTKMSRSKGNTIDPLDLFDEYGTDAVRFGLLYQSSTQDFPYSRERAEMGSAFVTKLWNAMRFVLAYPEADEGGDLSPSDRWILSKFNRTVKDYDAFLEECEFSEAMRRIYSFAWNQFADWYIEIAKASPSKATPRVLRDVFRGVLKLLHPVMPYATEEMANITAEETLLATQRFPEYDHTLEDEEADSLLERTKRAVSAVRSFRAESKVEGELEGLLPRGVDEDVFVTLARVKLVETSDGANRASLPAGDVVVEILLSDEMRRGEIERLRREVSRAEQEVKRSEGKLANEKFVQNAPENVVASEREKLDVNARMLETLARRLEDYL
jgi:valyl-tRNA synthetase